jgi:sugar lactone lactonase YvrE
VNRRPALALVAAAAVAASATAATASTAATHRQRLDVRVLAHVPAPGYPALSLVTPDRRIYVGTFTNPQGQDTGPSKVFAYSSSGRLLRTWTVRGQTPGAAHGVQVAERDARGRLYLLDQNPSRVLVLDPRTGRQTTYATFSDLPSCSAANRPDACSNTVLDNPPEPDYAAWAPDGALLVTDYTQGVIWRVPPHGGRATVWMSDPRFDGTEFGPAGIVMLPGGRELLLSTSAGGVTTAGNPTAGKLYRISVDGAGRPGRIRQIWESGPTEAPDGFAVARSGHIYLALVGPGANTVVELSAAGGEIARVPASPVANASQDVPFDEPSSVQFLDDRLIVTNDAYFSGDASHFVLFDVYAGAGERGAPHYLPRGAGLR